MHSGAGVVPFPFEAVFLYQIRNITPPASPEHNLDSDGPSALPPLQIAAACLLGQLGQQGVTFDLQPKEWIAAATHALSAPTEVRPAREGTATFSPSQTLELLSRGKTELLVSLKENKECQRNQDCFLLYPFVPRY